MSRHAIDIRTPDDKRKAATWCQAAPVGMRIEFRTPTRSTEQNRLLWSLLGEIEAHMTPLGRIHTTDMWKAMFMQACGQEVAMLPSLDRKTLIPYGQSSSVLTVKEMTDLIEFILAWGAENGIQFKDTGPAAASAEPAEGAAAPPPAAAPSTIHFDWLQNIARMLVAATHFGGDMDLLKNQKRAALASFEKPADCPEIIRGKAEAVFGYCRQIVLKELEFTDGLAVIAGVCGCEPDDLQRSAK